MCRRSTHVMDLEFTSTESVFRSEEGIMSTSPTRLAGTGRSIDPIAVHSLLQLGAMVPPLSPWQGVSRLVPGKFGKFLACGDALMTQPRGRPTCSLEFAVSKVVEALDNTLLKLERPVLLFSGGVDSGLIAARLSALQRKEALLIHCSFGALDKETEVALAMADHLGLRIESWSPTESELWGCLDNPGAIYPAPFGDESTAPMAALAKHITTRFHGERITVIDGTGADGVFGMGSKVRQWRSVFSLPRIVRGGLGLPYTMGAWKSNGPIEYVSRLMKRASELTPSAACIAQNSLSQILYSNVGAKRVCQALDSWVETEVGQDLEFGMVAADVGLTCANIFAQKGLPILRKAEFKVCYPFLNDAMLHLGIDLLGEKFAAKPKVILKEALKKSVPPNMVDRPKAGFVDSSKTIFFSNDFIEILAAAVEAEAPLEPFLFRHNLKKVCALLRARKRLPQQTLNCLWAIAFADRWYRTAE